ncbi:hypothetical protein [Streptomyces sp. NPDC007264]|uniref:hypothetical protein n=1 Tax=Streptomyces sp. NPDC007264 TaxID=3364777 RepID=UPI0036DCC1B9
MRSKMRAPVQRQARVRDRFGAVLTAAMSVLSVEAVIGAIALLVWGQTQERPDDLPYNALGVLFLILMAPFAAAAGAVVAAVLSIGVVMPLLVMTGWFGRRFSGREAWWWVPALAAAGTAPTILAAAVIGDADVLAGLGGWLAVTVALATTALVARRLLLPDRPWLSGGAMFGRVASYGALAVTIAGLLGISLWAGIGYEPPRLGAEGVSGTWSDGKGGTLTLTAGGKATATRVETFELDDSFETVVHKCTGTGTWKYDPGAGPWSQEVAVFVGDCRLDTWRVFGTSEHPKLFVYIGDPDSSDLYVLQRRDQAVPSGPRPEPES